MKCEGPNCRERGIYRGDYDALLCNTHAELPSFRRPLSVAVRKALGVGVACCVVLVLWVYCALILFPWRRLKAAVSGASSLKADS